MDYPGFCGNKALPFEILGLVCTLWLSAVCLFISTPAEVDRDNKIMKSRHGTAVILVLMLKMSFLGDIMLSYLVILSASPGANWGNDSANRSTATNMLYQPCCPRRSTGRKFNISVLFCMVGINCYLLSGCSQSIFRPPLVWFTVKKKNNKPYPWGHWPRWGRTLEWVQPSPLSTSAENILLKVWPDAFVFG